MDDETKKIALEKLDYVKAYVGYPSELLDNEKLDNYYQNLKIHPKSFIKNQLSLNSFHMSRNFEQLRVPFDRTRNWINLMSPTDVNALYKFFENTFSQYFFLPYQFHHFVKITFNF